VTVNFHISTRFARVFNLSRLYISNMSSQEFSEGQSEESEYQSEHESETTLSSGKYTIK
jgi:hypothetical protein